MFLRRILKFDGYLKRNELANYLNEDNLNKKTKIAIKRMGRKIKDKESWIQFKYWVLFKWVNLNFSISEAFYTKLQKNIKKLELPISLKEEKFIIDVQELYFNTWRPLKDLPVRFKLNKKEQINFLQKNVNIHNFYPDLKEKKIQFYFKGDLYFSNKNIYLANEHQDVFETISYNDIEGVEIDRIGIIIQIKNKKYLFRGQNKLLTYVILQRMIPNLDLDIQKVPKLYDYFDIWNNVLQRFN